MNWKNAHNIIHFRHPPKKGFISVIIPVFKDAKGLIDTLSSLKEQSLPQSNFEVIVGNDSHLSPISEVCKKFGVKEVFTKIKEGPYILRNLAIKASEGEYLSFTDADICVSDSWLENILGAFEKGYDYIGGPVIIDTSKIRTLTNKFVSYYEFDNQGIFQSLHFTATANVHVRRKVIEEIGAFDNRLFSSGDYEFGDRVYRSTKWNQLYLTNIPVIHPPREYSAFLSKLKRISNGSKDLGTFYPTRFSFLKRSVLRELLSPFYLPKTPQDYPFILQIQLTVLAFWFQLYRSFQNIKNR